MKEFLKALNLEESLVSKILTEIGTNYIPKEKYDKKNLELTELKDKYKDYEAISSDKEKLQTKYSELESKYNDDIKNYSERVNSLELDNILNLKLLSLNAKNVEVVGKFIDKSKLTLENGDIKGLNEQIESVKTQYGYLFKDTEDVKVSGVEPTVAKENIQPKTLLGTLQDFYKN